MRILVTGTTGVGKKQYLKEVCELAQRQGLTIKVLHLERIMREADLTALFDEATMYHLGREYLQLLCAITLRDFVVQCAHDAEQQGVQAVILEMHLSYWWNQSPFSIASPHHLADWFKPDLVVTLIDDVHEIHAALCGRPDPATQRFLTDGNRFVNILQWRSYEIMMAEQVARVARRFDKQRNLQIPGCFILAKALGPDTLLQLATQSRYAGATKPRRIVYPSFTITRNKGDEEEKQQARAAVDNFRKAMATHFIALDPYAISEKMVIDSASKSTDEEVSVSLRNGETVGINRADLLAAASIIDGQIVERDDRLVGSAEAVVAYLSLQENGEPLLSSGGSFERVTGYARGKHVIVVSDSEIAARGPFYRRLATAIFRTTDEAVEWFRQQGWVPEE